MQRTPNSDMFTRFLPTIGRKTSVLGATVLILSLLGAAACNRGTGCPATQQAQTGVDKHGKLSKRRGSSNLFPKEMRRGRH